MPHYINVLEPFTGPCRSWRSLRSFGGLETAEDQKIAAFGSSYRGAFVLPTKKPAEAGFFFSTGSSVLQVVQVTLGIQCRHATGASGGNRLAVDVVSHVTGGEDAFEVGRSGCLLYTSPSPRDRQKSRMPSSA